jgi:dephospho-CoA kinase
MSVGLSFVFAGKPIIGIAGGIGSGKSFVARLFGELGCFVIDSDELVRLAYQETAVRKTLRRWWGDVVFRPDGEINRSEIARRIFSDPAEKQRLEQLLHPLANSKRDRLMESVENISQVLAYVWDTPLLFETDLNRQCDAVVYVEAPLEARLARVAETRGWGGDELARREKLQLPLDKKQELSDYVIRNTADAGETRSQVREVLSRILAGSSQKQTPG